MRPSMCLLLLAGLCGSAYGFDVFCLWPPYQGSVADYWRMYWDWGFVYYTKGRMFLQMSGLKEDIVFEANMHPPNSFLQEIGKKAVLKLLQEKDGQKVPIEVHVPAEVEEVPVVEELTCGETTKKFRTYDGTCNNLQNPLFGSRNMVFRRLLDPDYDDGITSARSTAIDGSPLPSARVVSTAVHTTDTVSDPEHTHALMQWGQYIAHDMSLTALSAASDGSTLDCSDCTPTNDECFPITVPEDKKCKVAWFERECMPFTRSMPAQTSGPRNQMNTITAYIDASTVYGSSEDQANKLRAFDSGLLKSVNVHHGETYMPQAKDSDDFEICMSSNDEKRPCFLAGDKRNTVTPGLISYHTLWVRAHNDIAGRLASINGHWNDERLFQETRKIIGALHQKIHYEEYLPEILGPALMEEYGLTSDGVSKYDASCSADLTNEFSTAGFRFGHTMIGNTLKAGNEKIKFHWNWFKPDAVYKKKNMIDQIAKGLMEDKCQKRDRFYADGVRNWLFLDLDLPAFNIQRGRDHGLPSYNKFMEHFELGVPKTFEELETVAGMDANTVEALKSVYSSVDDIDLYTGMLCEPDISGGVASVLIAHILGEQFERLKKCDRFFYTHDTKTNGFTTKQLDAIGQISFSHLMCAYFDIGLVQKNMFRISDQAENALQSCHKYAPLSLDAWTETQKQAKKLAKHAAKIKDKEGKTIR